MENTSEVEVALETCFLLVVNVLAVSGNLMVCLAVYRNRSLLTVPYLSVLALSISDLSVALLCVPFCISGVLQGGWVFGYVFCQLNGFIVYIWAATSVYVLMLTAINRFFRVCKPATYRRLFTMKNTLFVIATGCVLIICGGLTATFFGPVIYKYNPRRFFCIGHYDNKQKRLEIGLTLHVVHVFVPMVVILVCYFKVSRTVRLHNSAVLPSLQALGPNMNLSVTLFEARVTRLLFAVLVGFALCWTPVFVVGVLGHGFAVPLPRFADLAYTFLALTSSVINPFIYGVMNRAFRKEFMKILRCSR